MWQQAIDGHARGEKKKGPSIGHKSCSYCILLYETLLGARKLKSFMSSRSVSTKFWKASHFYVCTLIIHTMYTSVPHVERRELRRGRLLCEEVDVHVFRDRHLPRGEALQKRRLSAAVLPDQAVSVYSSVHQGHKKHMHQYTCAPKDAFIWSGQARW